MSDIGKAGWKNQCKERSGGITDTELGSSREAKTSRLGVCCRGERGYRGGGGKESSKPWYKAGLLNVMSTLIDKEGRITK